MEVELEYLTVKQSALEYTYYKIGERSGKDGQFMIVKRIVMIDDRRFEVHTHDGSVRDYSVRDMIGFEEL